MASKIKSTVNADRTVAGQSIIAGVKQAIAWVKGEAVGARETVVHVPKSMYDASARNFISVKVHSPRNSDFQKRPFAIGSREGASLNWLPVYYSRSSISALTLSKRFCTEKS